MKVFVAKALKRTATVVTIVLISLLGLRIYDSQRGAPLEPWHTRSKLSFRRINAGWLAFALLSSVSTVAARHVKKIAPTDTNISLRQKEGTGRVVRNLSGQRGGGGQRTGNGMR